MDVNGRGREQLWFEKTFDSSVEIFHTANFGSLYPVLKRLTDKGMVEKQWLKEIMERKRLCNDKPEG
ncbi:MULTISPECIES: helix-turn-helix transcriptional regulator [unclassified Paenibacillus]|uniref:helix-turn-helix transcriptional regulator n=1 Tax=unclassified Paenibacillus TaxID=185978 RepID=UPI0036AF05AC